MGILTVMLALAAQGMVPPPAPLIIPPPAHVAAVPRQPLEQLFSPDDYPVAAERARQQGRVRVLLRVNANGRVTNCDILRSSGVAQLDVTACRLLAVRARFEPGRDKDGVAVESAVQHEVSWTLPDRSNQIGLRG